MTIFKTAEDLENYLESNCGGHYAVRGLDDHNATIDYNDGDAIARSYDMFDDRGIEYNDAATLLDGTCGLGVGETMYADELQDIVNRAKKYGTRVILIRGTAREDGDDLGENIIIDATFCGEIEF